MKKFKKTLAALAMTGTLATAAVGILVPASALAYDGTTYNYIGMGGWGGYGYGVNGLPQDFVLSYLFGGPYGNGVLGLPGSLGNILMVDQIFRNPYLY